MDVVMLVIARPLVLLALLTIAYGVSKGIARLIPEGPIKRALYKRRALY